jgi:hypothetical protein
MSHGHLRQKHWFINTPTWSRRNQESRMSMGLHAGVVACGVYSIGPEGGGGACLVGWTLERGVVIVTDSQPSMT